MRQSSFKPENQSYGGGGQTGKVAWAIGIIIVVFAIFYITQYTELIPGTHIYRPDLEVSAAYDEDVIQLLDPCDGYVTVRNVGGATATGVNLSLNYDGFGLGGTLNWSVGTLAPDESESYDFTLPSGVGKGDHYFTVTATCNEGSTDTESFVVHVTGVL